MAHQPKEWTNSPRKRVHAAFKGTWRCPNCGKELKGYWLSCPTDGAERPVQ
jgi:ribosomal protein L37AE/L43A